MNLTEARAKIPELKGLDDTQALNVIHQAYYPDMDKAELGKALGYTAPVPESEQGDMSRGFEKAMRQIPQTAGGAAALVGDLVGSDGLKDYGLGVYNKQEEAIQKITKPSDSFSSVLEGEGSPIDFLQSGIGYVGGQALTALATGGAGGFIGSQLAKQGAKQAIAAGVAKEVAAQAVKRGAIMGAGTAAFGSNLMQEAGSIYPEALQQAEKDGRTLDGGDKARIVGSSLAAAGVDTAMEGVMAGRLLHGGRKAGESMVRAAGREVPLAMAREGATEGIQTGIERFGAGQDLTTADAIRDYVDSAALGALGGGLGGGASVLNAQKVPEAGPLTRAANVGIDEQILQLTNDPQPLVSFPDGSVGHKQDLAAYLSQFTDPEERQAKEREIMGRDPKTGKKVEAAPAPEPTAADTEANSDANLKAWSAKHDPVPLDYAQALIAAPGAKGLDLMIAPHASGKGYTVVPSKWLSLDAQARAGALQRGDGAKLPSPDMPAPAGAIRVDSEGGAAPETYAEQARTTATNKAAAQKREELDVMVPRGAAPAATVTQPEEANAALNDAADRVQRGTGGDVSGTGTDSAGGIGSDAQSGTGLQPSGGSVPAGSVGTTGPSDSTPELILNPQGETFKTEMSAKRKLKEGTLAQTHEIVKSPESGWFLQKKAEVAPAAVAPVAEESAKVGTSEPASAAEGVDSSTKPEPVDSTPQPSNEAADAEPEAHDLPGKLKSAIKGFEAEIQDWSSRQYKKNKTQVDLHGDGPSSRASLSVGGINEGRRQKVIADLHDRVGTLKKVIGQYEKDPAKLLDAVEKALANTGFYESYPHKNGDELKDMAVAGMVLNDGHVQHGEKSPARAIWTAVEPELAARKAKAEAEAQAVADSPKMTVDEFMAMFSQDDTADATATPAAEPVAAEVVEQPVPAKSDAAPAEPVKPKRVAERAKKVAAKNTVEGVDMGMEFTLSRDVPGEYLSGGVQYRVEGIDKSGVRVRNVKTGGGTVVRPSDWKNFVAPAIGSTQAAAPAEKKVTRIKKEAAPAAAARESSGDSETIGRGASTDAIDPFDQTLLLDIAKGGSTNDVLSRIESESANPQYRELAAALKAMGLKTTIEFGDSTGAKFAVKGIAAAKFAAGYKPKADVVLLFMPKGAETSVLHELTHAATFKAIRSGGLAARQMTDLYRHVEQTGVMKGLYAMENLDEFVAEAFSNPQIQNLLRDITAMPSGSAFRNAWDKFVAIVRGILGLKNANALDQVMKAGAALMEENKAIRAGEQGETVMGATAAAAPTGAGMPPRMAFAQSMGVKNSFGRVLDGNESKALATAVHKGDVAAMLRQLAKSASPTVRFVAESAQQFSERYGQPLKLRVSDAEITDRLASGGSRTTASGVYDQRDHTMVLQPGRAMSEHTVAHELTHALTMEAIIQPTAAQVEHVDALVDLFSHVSRDGRLSRVYGMTNMAEFIAEGFSNPDFQYELTRIEYDGGTAWGKFTGMIAKLLGMKNDNAFMELMRIGEALMGGSEATRQAATDETVLGSVGAAYDMLKSAKTLGETTDTLKNMLLKSDRKLGLWSRTIGTQFDKATKDSDFKRVFDAYNQQTEDTAHYAIEAERLAPGVLQRLDNIKDIGKALVNSGGKFKADLEAASKALFANIEGKEGVQQKLYTDAELRSEFKLTDPQILMYRQVRAAVDTSIDRLAQTTIASMGEAAGMDISALKNLSAEETAKAVIEGTDTGRIGKDIGGNTRNEDLHERINELLERTNDLKAKAYMPAMRFGEYAVTVLDAAGGDPIHFEMFESQTAANIAAMKLAKEYPGKVVDKSVLNPDAYAMFKGVSPETVELFAKYSGMDQNEAYKDYIALAKSSRSTLQRLQNRKGTAGFSEDATRVLASFLTSNARQSAMNMNAGEVNAAMASPTLARKGDVQREAQKLHEYMSNPREEAQKLRGFLFMHFIGGSIASSITNLTQPILQTTPYLSQYAGGKTAGIMMAAAKQAATGKIENADLRAAMEKAKADGIVEPHELFNLMADASGSTLGTSLRARALTKAWGSFFSLSESYNRRLTFLAAYQTGMHMGQEKLAAKGFKDAYAFAQRAIIETQGLYSKFNKPNWARGPVGATLFVFKQFSISYIEFFNRLPNKQKALALGILIMAAGVQGIPFADDLEDLIDTLGQTLGYNTNSKKWVRDHLLEVFGDDLGEILTSGISQKTGVDMSGRLGMGNLIPGTGLLKMSEPDKSRDVAEVAGALGGVLTSFQKAFGRVQAGDYAGGAREMAPTAIKNALQGVDMAQTGSYKDGKGRKVRDVDMVDSIIKGLGFQPQQIAAETRKISDMMQDKGMRDAIKHSITDRLVNATFDGDQAGVAKAREVLAEWNRTNDDRIVISPVTIRQRLVAMRQTREQRFLKTVPKALRAQAREDLAD